MPPEAPRGSRARGERCRIRGCAQPAVGRSQLCAPHLTDKLTREREQREEARAAGGGNWSAWAPEIPDIVTRDEAGAPHAGGPKAEPAGPTSGDGKHPGGGAGAQRRATGGEPSLEELRASVRREIDQNLGWLPVSGLFDSLGRASQALGPEAERSVLESVRSAGEQGLLDPVSALGALRDAVRGPLEGVARAAAGFANAAASGTANPGGSSDPAAPPPGARSALSAGLFGALGDATRRARARMDRAGVSSLLNRAAGAARDALRLGVEAGRRAVEAAPDVIASAADSSRRSPLEELLARVGLFGESARTRSHKGLARTLLERTLLAPLLRVPPRVLALRTEGMAHLPRRGGALIVASPEGSLLLTGAVVATALRPAARLRPVRVLTPPALLDLPLAARLLPRLGFVPARIEVVEELLDRGGLLVAFPLSEATGTSGPTEASPAHVVSIALASRVPVLPCGVHAIDGAAGWIPAPLRPFVERALRTVPLGWSVRLGPELSVGASDAAEDLAARAGSRAEELAFMGSG